MQIQLINHLAEKDSLASLTKENLSALLMNSQLQLHRLSSALIDELLETSRMRVGRLPLEPRDIDLSEMVRHEVQRLQTELDEAGCRVELHLDPRVKGRIGMLFGWSKY